MGLFGSLGSVGKYNLGAVISVDDAQAISKLGKLQKAQYAVRKGFDRMGAPLKKLRGALGAFAGPMGLAGVVMGVKKVVTQFAEFEHGLAKVQTLLSPGVNAMEMYGEQVKSLSLEVGKSTSDMNEALFQAISAGVDTGKAMEFMEVASKASVGGFTDMTTAVNGLTNVVNAYGLSIDEATKVSDAMFAANKVGKTTFPELSNSIGNAATVAAQAGITYQEVFATIASLTKQGIDTNKASYGIRQVAAALIKPSKEAQKMAKEFGIDFSIGGMEKAGGFLDFMDDMTAKIDKASGGDKGIKSKAIMSLFKGPRAGAIASAMMHESGLKFAKDTMAEMAAQGSLTEKSYADAADTTMHKIDQLKTAWGIFLTETGGAIVEAFGVDGGTFVKSFTEWIKEVRPKISGFFKTLKEIADVVLPHLGTALKLYLGIKGAKFLGGFATGLGNIAKNMGPAFGAGALGKMANFASGLASVGAAASVAYAGALAFFDWVDSQQEKQMKGKAQNKFTKGGYEALKMGKGARNEFIQEYMAEREGEFIQKKKVSEEWSPHIDPVEGYKIFKPIMADVYNEAAMTKIKAEAEEAYKTSAAKDVAEGAFQAPQMDTFADKIGQSVAKYSALTVNTTVDVKGDNVTVGDNKTNVNRGATPKSDAGKAQSLSFTPAAEGA